MFPATTKGGGNAFCFPDVCKTPAPPLPPIPIPYPNTGMMMTAEKTSAKVKFDMSEAVTLKSEIPSTNGDEAGVAGGLVSGKNMDKCTFKMGSTSVKIEGQPAIMLTSLSAHNGMNANMPAGCVAAPSQTKVLIMK